jgi:DNA-binding CsgD family transcriptional regulator
MTLFATATPFERAGEVIERLEALDELAVAAPAAAFEAGTAASCVWAHDLALPFLAAAVDGLRDQGRLGLLAQALATQAWAAIHVGDVDLALATSEEAVRLGEETRQSRWAAAAIAAQSAMIAEQGDFARAAVLASEAERALLPLGVNPLLSLVQFARGRAALAEGRFADAYLDLRRIADPGDIAHHPFVYAWTLADLIDAGLRGGVEIGEVRRHLDVLESLAKATTAPLLKAQLAFARPLLAADSQVEELFRIAVSRELESWPAWRGRALLAYGAWLRRQQRIADSRSPLREAYELFDRLGFVALSERALQELRASGERKQRRTSETRNRLTPQELQIAQMAAEGLSNRAIGQKLYLSERTVASHLYRVFPKLGISARGQLAAALLRV